MNPTYFVKCQFALFALTIIFAISLLFGATIPTGPEGEWFTKIWEIYLVVSNFASLGIVIKQNDELIAKATSLPQNKEES